MAIRQYIGARYVLKIYENSTDPASAEWEPVAFEPLIMVTYANNSYISRKNVPATIGNPADNPQYWAQTGFYNGQIMSLQAQVDAIRTELDDVSIEANRFSVDNDVKNTTSIFTNLTWDMITKMRPMLSVRMPYNKWTPSTDPAIEMAMRTIVSESNISYQLITNGIKATASGGGAAQLTLGNILKTPRSVCIHSKISGNKGNAEYCRAGISLDGGFGFVYFNNLDKKLYCEYDAASWTPTPLSDTVYDCEEIELYCFMGRDDHTVSVYADADGDGIHYVGSFTMTHVCYGEVGTFIRIADNTTVIAKITELETFFTFEVISDTKYIHYDDTTPFIIDNKAYFTATLQAFDVAFSGILRHTLGCNDLELVAVISCNQDDFSGLGTDMCFDRKNKRFICMFRRDVNGVKICYSISHNTSLNGIIDFKEITLPDVASHEEFGNYKVDEDPAVCFFNGHWYVAINRAESYPDYYYDIFRTTGEEFDITQFEYVTTVGVPSDSLTGASFYIVNDKLFLIAGNNNTISAFEADTGLKAGNFNITLDTRVWGNITSINRGNRTKFYLTTFDRVKCNPNDSWSYGNLWMYESADDNIPELITNNTYGMR